ncbi:MAG TPA: carbohydrate ABC transporter permease [Chloroflexota bacterium]
MVAADTSSAPDSRGGSTITAASHAAFRRGGASFRHIAVRTLGYVVLTVVAVACIFPLAWMVLTSLRTPDSAFGKSFIPTAAEWTVKAYASAFTSAGMGRGLVNSLIVTAATIAGVLIVATFGGYGFARFNFRGRRAIYIAILSTLMVPGAVLIIPLFLEFKVFHLLDSLQGLTLVYIATSVPFAVVLMRGFFERVPENLADAARIDGASELAVFFRVMLPLVRPAVLTLAVFQFLSSWNEFLLAETFLRSPNLLTVQPRVYAIVGQYSTNWSLLCAAVVISVIPVVILYVILQRRFVTGLTVGALRG